MRILTKEPQLAKFFSKIVPFSGLGEKFPRILFIRFGSGGER
jgi:hypothetical protein